MCATDIPGIKDLSASEKILLVEDLWDNITDDEGSMAVPESHKHELNRRLNRYSSNPGDLLSLKELQGRIEQRK